MGMKAAISWPPPDMPGEDWWYRVLRCLVTVAARVVLPEPGIPDTAMRRRRERGRCLYCSVFETLLVLGLELQLLRDWMSNGLLTPSFLHQTVYLLVHGGCIMKQLLSSPWVVLSGKGSRIGRFLIRYAAQNIMSCVSSSRIT